MVSKVHSYYRQCHLLSTTHPLLPSEFLFIFHISAQFQQFHFKLRKKNIFILFTSPYQRGGKKFCRDTILTQAYAKKKKKSTLDSQFISIYILVDDNIIFSPRIVNNLHLHNYSVNSGGAHNEIQPILKEY